MAPPLITDEMIDDIRLRKMLNTRYRRFGADQGRWWLEENPKNRIRLIRLCASCVRPTTGRRSPRDKSRRVNLKIIFWKICLPPPPNQPNPLYERGGREII